jgi:hypothetical protein
VEISGAGAIATFDLAVERVGSIKRIEPSQPNS